MDEFADLGFRGGSQLDGLRDREVLGQRQGQRRPAPIGEDRLQVGLGLVGRHQALRLEIDQFLLEDAQPAEIALRQQQLEAAAPRVQRQHPPDGRVNLPEP